MKRYKNIFLMLAVASIASACSEELNPNEINKANPGDEVQFGAALPGVTKTIYGDETETGFPIYWVGGDKVQVASPQCQSGRNNAEYLIGVNGAGQNYATSMTKTGEYGVQWGNTDEADFYSVYPAGSAVLSISGNDVKASLSIARAQTAKPKTTSATDLVFEPEDMNDVVMIAKEKKVPTGNVVNLKYIPFSTVIEFTIPGPTSSESGDAMEIIVQSLTLTAPEGTNIAGDFDFNLGGLSSTSKSGITDLSAENVSNASNSILLHIMDRNNAYAKVTKGQTLKVKMCLVPQQYTSLKGWTVTVSTNEGNYVKTIQSNQLNSDAEKNKLKSGLVHKVTLPALNYKGKWDYNLGDWIQTLPDYRNIYLSELSLPGAWYAGSTEDYQETSNIETLWNAGIRAFALETKTVSTTAKYAVDTDWQGIPVGIVVSGSGDNSTPTYRMGANSLKGNPTSTTSDEKVYSGGNSISSIISSLITQIKSKPEEYAVLVLSYADGGTSGLRYVDFGYWLKGLYDIYVNLPDKDKTYIYSDEINANTIVDKVRGKLILKINVDENIAKIGYLRVKSGLWGSKDYTYTYEDNLPALFSYNPFLFQMNGSEKYSVPFFSNLSWSTWGDDTDTHRKYMSAEEVKTLSNPFVWCFSSANRTQIDTGTDGTIPTYANRKAALGAMMGYSKQIYDASTHNVWFYFNCGGTEATSQTSSEPSPTAFASTMNPWLLEKITAKTDPSPLGIVMFNQCTNSTYKGPEIIKAIIEMNSRFYLKHAGTSGGSTGGSTGGSEDNTAQNDSSFDNGGEMF